MRVADFAFRAPKMPGDILDNRNIHALLFECVAEPVAECMDRAEPKLLRQNFIRFHQGTNNL